MIVCCKISGFLDGGLEGIDWTVAHNAGSTEEQNFPESKIETDSRSQGYCRSLSIANSIVYSHGQVMQREPLP
jgi:hypothetical protein